jgi:hypothetical protein
MPPRKFGLVNNAFSAERVVASASRWFGGIIAAVFKVKKEIPVKEPYL